MFIDILISGQMSYRIWGLNPKCCGGILGRGSGVGRGRGRGRGRGGRAILRILHPASGPTTLEIAMY